MQGIGRLFHRYKNNKCDLTLIREEQNQTPRHDKEFNFRYCFLYCKEFFVRIKWSVFIKLTAFLMASKINDRHQLTSTNES